MSDSEEENQLAVRDDEEENQLAVRDDEEEESSEEEDDEDEEESQEGQRKQGMNWINEPEEWSQHRTTVVMRVPPKTDFWRMTSNDVVQDDAPFYFLEVEGDFEVRVKVRANYDNPGDQAGVMVREDEENWMKCGIQMVGDVPHMCSTNTHGWSDWSLHPLPHLPEYMWVHAKKIGDGLEVYISEDSFDWMQIRQADIVDDAILQVGLYCAAPESDGFDVTFEDFMIKDEEK
jgi:regulation of enolase protein 1 (concanavalin A-like superfamily)